jgi:hypothetical protein
MISEDWLITGDGPMLKSEQLSDGGSDVIIPRDVWDIITAQVDSLKSKDKQIEELILLMKQQIAESKKTDARKEDDATSAV